MTNFQLNHTIVACITLQSDCTLEYITSYINTPDLFAEISVSIYTQITQ